MIEYKLRPVYCSKNEFLIEFLYIKNEEMFFTNLKNALSVIKPKISVPLLLNLYSYDDAIYKLKTNMGKSELSIDYLDSGFILAKFNQKLIKEIDRLLNESDLFSKQPSNDEDYN